MQSPPLVSVILPTFNRLNYLPATVASIFGQSFQNWELLIADDGSDDRTRAYLHGLSDPPRVQVRYLPHTGRPAVARNTALRGARGEYIAFMDSDDVWMPTKLESQIASLRARAHCGWSQTRFVLMNAARNSQHEMPAADGWILGRLLRTETVIALPSVIVSRALLESLGGFDENLVMCEDYDLWLRLAARSPIDGVDEPLTIVRRHDQHYGDSTMSFRDSIRVLDKVLQSGTAGEYEPFVHKERANSCAGLARCYAKAGERNAALGALLSSVRASWRHAGWRSDALKVLAAASVPQEVLRLIRRHRNAGH